MMKWVQSVLGQFSKIYLIENQINLMRVWCFVMAMVLTTVVAGGSPIYLPNESFSKLVDGETYEIDYRTALGALERAAEFGIIEYKLSSWEWGIFVDCIEGICAKNGGGWMYWVNYPTESMPVVSSDNYTLETGDVLTWYYAESWEDTPATSKCVMNFTVSESYELDVSVKCNLWWMVYDKDGNEAISDNELVDAIMDWLNGNLSDERLVNVIVKWLQD